MLPSSLVDAVTSKNVKLVEKELKEVVDVLDEEGMLFKLAIIHNSCSIMGQLLSHLCENQLKGLEERSIVAVKIRNKLREAIEAAEERSEVTQEMKNIISSYVNLGYGSCDDFLDRDSIPEGSDSDEHHSTPEEGTILVGATIEQV